MARFPVLFLAALLVLGAFPAAAVENEVCRSCHGEVTKGNPESPHLRRPVRCESCHGDGSRHAREGDPRLIRSFKGKPAADVCTTCHQDQHVAEWKASRHAQVDVDCIDCHAVHVVRDPKATCKGCH